MKHKGINYDVGDVLEGFLMRPTCDAEVVHCELEIIKNDLHCNAVKICGLDLDMASYSLVKSYADKHCTTYPDMPCEPKKSFKAGADYFAKQILEVANESPAS